MVESFSKEDFPISLDSNDKECRRTGLFGGTFDPIHLGHLQVAQEVKEQFKLDRIIFIPSAHPPHKTFHIIADAKDRIEMTRLAIRNRKDFEISDIELKRDGFSFTVDTIAHFKKNAAADAELFFILGLDAFLEIDTWKSYRELFNQVPFIIMTRLGAGKGMKGEDAEIINAYLKTKVSEDYKYASSENTFAREGKPLVYLFHVTPIDISSTRIRDAIRDNESIGHMVTDEVADYINVQGLYR